MATTSPKVKVVTSAEFGEVHYTSTADGVLYCVTDICKSLNLLIREGERIVERNRCGTRELFIKKKKKTVSHLFVDENGLLSLIIESRKSKANDFRMWLMGTVRPTRKTTAKPSKKSAPSTALIKENAEGSYPTLTEYFKEFVPVDYFVSLADDVIAYGLALAKTKSEAVRKEIYGKLDTFSTFRNTLAANSSLLCK